MLKGSIKFSSAFEELSDRFKTSQYTVVFSGAGISTPSGIADFRTPKIGLWERFNPMEFASFSIFRNEPEKFYSWLWPLIRAAGNARPNLAHEVIARLEKDRKISGVITQNIDGLHKKAGSENLAEVHGNLDRFICLRCRKEFSNTLVKDIIADKDVVPHCTDCGAILKPDIVLFEETLPEGAWEKAVTMAERSDLFIVTGSSLEVNPAAILPQSAKKQGACIIINTLLPTAMDAEADLVFRCDVVEFWDGVQRIFYG